MRLPYIKVVLFLLIITCFVQNNANAFAPNKLTINQMKKYQAIVLGKMVKKQVKKVDDYYITEYKLKPDKWLYKNPSVKKTKHLTIKILGAELAEKGIAIKASTAPDFVPMHKQAIFFLENTMKKQKNIYTISKNGIVYKET